MNHSLFDRRRKGRTKIWRQRLVESEVIIDQDAIPVTISNIRIYPELPLKRDELTSGSTYYVNDLSVVSQLASIMNLHVTVKNAHDEVYNTLYHSDMVIKSLMLGYEEIDELKKHLSNQYEYANLFILENMYSVNPSNWKQENNIVIYMPAFIDKQHEMILDIIHEYDVKTVICTSVHRLFPISHSTSDIGVKLSIKEITL